MMGGNPTSLKMGALHSQSARPRLLQTCSLTAVALILSTTPAQAQLAQMRAALGIAPVVVTPRNVVSVRPIGMREALARSLEHQAQVDGIRGVVLEAQKAAIAAIRNSALAAVKDGLTGANGSNADAGLDPVRSGIQAALDATGTKTWQGASLPTQIDNNGKPLVTIVQTDERAILSWNRFDVGANTTLNFEQKINGIAQPNWIALNRVGNSVAPSRILGTITADGTVAVINSRGVIFEKGSQVNLHSLLVSSLEIGNLKYRIDDDGPVRIESTTLLQRNLTFLQSGFQTQGFKDTANLDIAPSFTSSLLVGTNGSLFGTPLENDVIVDAGASITASNGGFIIMTAPNIRNSGVLTAADGQVSLQAGREITARISTGSDTDPEIGISTGISPDVRGIVLRTNSGVGGTLAALGYGGTVTNTGLIEVPRGYISLGAAEEGIITNAGLLSATTSVARTAKISLTGPTINLVANANKGLASGIVVTSDTNGETVPIGTAMAPPNFKPTKIEIGNLYLSRGQTPSNNSGGPVAASIIGPAAVSFGSNSILLAPNADVTVGGRFVDPNAPGEQGVYHLPSLGNIDVETGAIIDVSGVKDLLIDASRNSLLIDPLKRNELRDTPTYREVTTNGGFTLNGATVYVDPRLSGVRSDGVAWVGSPLLEAGSAASQIGVTAAELMTRGGTISMTVAVADRQVGTPGASIVSPLNAPTINIAKDSVIDFSGGWTHYGEGVVRSSKLLTADGRIVDIGNADPNDNFIAVGDGFTEIQSKYGISRTFANSLLQGGRFETSYDEGRDAGALALTATKLELNGTLFGQAFTGARQAAGGIRSTRTSPITGDARKLQATAQQLPSSGALTVSSGYLTGTPDVRLGADILVYHGDRATIARPFSEMLISDATLSDAGLSGLSLFSTGNIAFAADTDIALDNGSTFSILAGRVSFDGKLDAPSGQVTAATGGFLGSAFRVNTVAQPNLPAPAGITVNGLISVAGLWTNDFGKIGSDIVGAGYGAT